MVKLNEKDFKQWDKFRRSKRDTLTGAEFKMVSDLHSKYYNHKFYLPCTCNPNTIKRWIKDINLLFDNGTK